MQSTSTSYDVVIIGTGVAGLATAIYLAEAAASKDQPISILLASKAGASDTNTSWAQGGIAAVASFRRRRHLHTALVVVAVAVAQPHFLV